MIVDTCYECNILGCHKTFKDTNEKLNIINREKNPDNTMHNKWKDKQARVYNTLHRKLQTVKQRPNQRLGTSTATQAVR